MVAKKKSNWRGRKRYPEINSNGGTSVKGLYIIGDLIGIPLQKLATENGKKIIDYLISDSEFQKLSKSNSDREIYDIIIVGAGSVVLLQVWKPQRKI